MDFDSKSVAHGRFFLFVCFPSQSTTNASAGSTTATTTPCASTWSEATAAPASQVTLATEQSAKVSHLESWAAFKKEKKSL